MKIKHYGFIIGLFAVIISFIFYARQQSTYRIFLLSGLIVSFTCYMFILLTKGSKRNKLLWSFILLISIAIQVLTEPLLTRSSFKIFISQNQAELNQINNILLSKNSEISISKNSIVDKGQLSLEERQTIKDLFKKVNVLMILKNDDEIYYIMTGYIDIKVGVIYRLSTPSDNENLRHLMYNW